MYTELQTKLGEIAYNKYCDTRNWKSFDGKPLPKWSLVNPDIQIGWIEAANEAVHYLVNTKLNH